MSKNTQNPKVFQISDRKDDDPENPEKPEILVPLLAPPKKKLSICARLRKMICGNYRSAPRKIDPRPTEPSGKFKFTEKMKVGGPINPAILRSNHHFQHQQNPVSGPLVKRVDQSDLEILGGPELNDNL